MKILSIDPSINKTNGICIKENGIIIEVAKLDSLDVLKKIEIGGFDIVIIEDPRLKGVFRKNSHRRVGSLDGAVKMYEKMARKWGAKTISVMPCGLNNIVNNSFPEPYKEYKNRSEHEKVAILLHDKVDLTNIIL